MCIEISVILSLSLDATLLTLCVPGICLSRILANLEVTLLSHSFESIRDICSHIPCTSSGPWRVRICHGVLCSRGGLIKGSLYPLAMILNMQGTFVIRFHPSTTQSPTDWHWLFGQHTLILTVSWVLCPHF